MNERPSLSVLVALAIATACALALQVILTRLFSAVMAYHFSFLAISLSMLGTSAGALFIYLNRDRLENTATDPFLARLCGALSLLLILLPVILVRVNYTQRGAIDPVFVLNLIVCCVLATLPCFVAGMVVAVAIDRYRDFIGPVYAFDLVGAGLGAVLIVPTLSLASAPALMVCLGAVSAIAALLFAGVSKKSLVWSTALVALAIAVVGLSRISSVLYLPHYYALPTNVVKVAERWTPLARVFGFKLPSNNAMALLFYDRVFAPVPIVRGGELPDWQQLITGPGSIGYELTGPGRTLIIGGGGGRDIYTALASGQRSIDVIELIDANRRVVDEDLGDLSGHPYSRAHVKTVIGDGRSVLANRSTKYDQIYIGLTDTLSANAAQGFALTENNLYTVEAFEEYFNHLRPRGVVNLTRPLKQVGDEALRMTVLALGALEHHGIAHPFDHVVVVLGNDIFGQAGGTVLVRLEPYTEPELQKLRTLAEQRGTGLALVPGGPNNGAWAQLARASGIEAFCKGYRLNVCPPTDDKPFFFTMQRLSQFGQTLSDYYFSIDPYSILMLTLAILTGLSVLVLLLPLFLAKTVQRPTALSVSFFAAIGLGFMLLEVVLIQRLVLFLGFPTYALSVVLFSLLIFSGIGSYLSQWFHQRRRTLLIALALLTLFIGVSAFGMQGVLRAMIQLPFAVRAIISVALIVPFGVTAGMAMPLGLSRFAADYPHAVAYAWGVNGATSVLASVLGVAVAINFGFTAASLLSAGCYLVALAQVALTKSSSE